MQCIPISAYYGKCSHPGTLHIQKTNMHSTQTVYRNSVSIWWSGAGCSLTPSAGKGTRGTGKHPIYRTN